MTYSEVKKPWGKYVILEKTKTHWIKKLFITKGAQLSLQSHQKRSEIWIVISGKIEAIKGNSSFLLKTGESLKIEKKEKHRIKAVESACVLEVAFGQVLESDIFRFADSYGRIK